MIRPAAAFVLLLASGVAGAAAAQPGGSYQRSCRNVSYSGGRLSAECGDTRGRWRGSTIAANQCRGDIGNADGVLVCNGATATPTGGGYDDRGGRGGGGYDGRGGTPRGSYTRSCRDVRVQGDRLTASCDDGRGHDRTSSLDYRSCRGEVANVNGSLVCPGGTTTDAGRGRGGYDDRDRDRYGERDRGGYGRDRYDGPR